MSLFELVTVYMKKLRASDRLKKKCTFHVTPVQNWNTSANYKQRALPKFRPSWLCVLRFTGSCNCVVFEKFTRTYDQIALEIMLLFKLIFELIPQDVIVVLVVVSRLFHPFVWSWIANACSRQENSAGNVLKLIRTFCLYFRGIALYSVQFISLTYFPVMLFLLMIRYGYKWWITIVFDSVSQASRLTFQLTVDSLHLIEVTVLLSCFVLR